MRVELTQEIVRELLDYDPVTGTLTWKWRDRKWFEENKYYRSGTWNSRFAGKVAGRLDDKGYIDLRLFGRHYKAHRVIFLFVEGRWPDPEVDHENHVRSDNRWNNLFEKNRLSNAHNMVLHNTNTSGRVGVSWCKRTQSYEAYIRTVDCKKEYLGRFRTFEEACVARKFAEQRYGFHERHGERRPSRIVYTWHQKGDMMCEVVS